MLRAFLVTIIILQMTGCDALIAAPVKRMIGGSVNPSVRDGMGIQNTEGYHTSSAYSSVGLRGDNHSPYCSPYRDLRNGRVEYSCMKKDEYIRRMGYR